MTKFIITSKIKKKLLYYNMQISVDKDFMAEGITFYKDSPIVLTFIYQDHWGNNMDKIENMEIWKPIESTNLYLSGIILFNICDGSYPFPEIIQVDYNGTIFTFTPIPVYE